MNNKRILIIVVCAASMGIGAGGTYLSNRDKIEFAEKYSLMLETEKFMKETAEVGAPDNPNDAQIINAYLSMYGDPYTYYREVDIYSKDYIENRVNNSAVALGSGFKIYFDENDRLLFSEIIPNLSAAECGFEKNDVITAIDGQNVSEYKDAKKLLGAQDTTVNLTIERNGEKKEISLIRKKESTELNGIKSKMRDNTLCVTFDQMLDSSGTAFENAIKGKNFDSIVIDLRNNGGGDIAVALSIADIFINKADVKFISKSGSEYTRSTEDGVDVDVPIAVIINDNTASSAEILTALLKQNSRTTLVGTRTFGKGIYQSNAIFNGNQLHYTDGYITVGDWECWQGKGIAPDIEVEMDSSLIGTDEDIQLQKALEVLEN